MQFLGAAEVALLLGVSRQRVHQLVSAPGFPDPLERLASGAIWSTEAVASWAQERGRAIHPERLTGAKESTNTTGAP